MKKSLPDVTHHKTKSLTKEDLERGQRANTGGDHYDRSRGNYSKNAPHKGEDDPFEGF